MSQNKREITDITIRTLRCIGNRYIKMDKTTIETFTKNENEIKVKLLNEIKEEFKSYNTNEVLLYLENVEEHEELENLLFSINPLTQDKYCQIDGTATPCFICYKDEKLILSITGECRDPERDYVTLEEPIWSLSVEGLYNLLLLLQHPQFKELQKKLDEDAEKYEHFTERFNKYSDMKIVCSYNGAETTLKEFFNSITDDEDNVIEEFSEWLEDGDEEEQTMYEAFVAALQHNNWFENNGIEDSNNIIITGLNDRTLFDDKLENLEAY